MASERARRRAEKIQLSFLGEREMGLESRRGRVLMSSQTMDHVTGCQSINFIALKNKEYVNKAQYQPLYFSPRKG